MNKITYEQRAKVYADALDTYGLTGQLLKALEELTEVQLEIYRIMEGRPNVMHLAEEVADATLMLEQVRLMFGINEEVCEFMDAKVLRLQNFINAKERQRPDPDMILALIRSRSLCDCEKTESGLIEED